jgi:hypothetical protein
VAWVVIGALAVSVPIYAYVIGFSPDEPDNPAFALSLATLLAAVAFGSGARYAGDRGGLGALAGIALGLIAMLVLTLRMWASVPGADAPVVVVGLYVIVGLVLSLVAALGLRRAWHRGWRPHARRDRAS